ncbi:RAD51-associated protein 1 [Rhinophrynus dorsalis]
MDRPVRMKKSVDYSQFGDIANDDEDFAFCSAPPSKKARVEKKKDKEDKSGKKSRKEETAFQQAEQGKRPPLDEKLYQRDLELALALSVQNTSVIVENGQAKEVPTFTDGETSEAAVSFSNCSVDSSTLGLDEITNGNEDRTAGRSRRQAASKAITEQRKILVDDSGDDEAADDFKPDDAACESESDSSFSGEDEDEEFKLQKSKKSKASKSPRQKKNEKRERISKSKTSGDESESSSSFSGDNEKFAMKQSKKSKANKSPNQKSKSEKKENITAKPKAAGSSVSPPVSIKVKSLPSITTPVSSPASAKSVLPHSPPVGMKRPTWSPPAVLGNVKSPLGGSTVKSPNQGLRLGLSRLARVKPLHPTVVNH